MRRFPGLVTILAGGNHDPAGRLEAPSPILESLDVHVFASVRRSGAKVDHRAHMVPLASDGKTVAWFCAASLKEPFNIDLTSEPLASAGLFAITGETGAGKSTILDAMCLALYGDCPRLAHSGINDEIPDTGRESIRAKDSRAILRRGAASGFAEVDFVAPDGIAYRARWGARRARGRADGRLQNVERAPPRPAHPRPSISVASLRTTCLPRTRCRGIAARHSLVPSSMMSRHAKPPAVDGRVVDDVKQPAAVRPSRPRDRSPGHRDPAARAAL